MQKSISYCEAKYRTIASHLEKLSRTANFLRIWAIVAIPNTFSKWVTETHETKERKGMLGNIHVAKVCQDCQYLRLSLLKVL